MVELSRAVLAARRHVYRQNQDTSQDNLRREIAKCYDPEDDKLKYRFFHYGALGNTPEVPSSLPVSKT